MGFPKWVYHKTEKAKIIETEDEQKELGKGWLEIPFPVNEEVEAEIAEEFGEADGGDHEQVSYKEHMASYESKAEKAAKLKNRDAKVTEKHRHSKKQKEAQ